MISFGFILKEMTIGAVSFLVMISVFGMAYIPNQYIHRAEAIPVVVTGGVGTLQETLSAIANVAVKSKDFLLDPAAWLASDYLIQTMTKDIVKWINSGFKGKPAFMQDLGGFLTNVADNEVGKFIADEKFGKFLCSPFQLDVRLALSIQYAKSRNYGSPGSACTFTGVTANLDKFFERGAFAGGWDQWFKVTQDAQYNPHGALLLAQEQLDIRLRNQKGQQIELLGWGKGFLSSQECTRIDSREVCRTVTPGTTIEGALNDALGNPSKRIAVADEINEIIGALFGQLVTQAFNGAGGLLGLTGDGGGGQTGSTYFDDLTLETIERGGSGTNAIQESITTETRYRDLIQSYITKVQNTATYKNDTYGVSNYCHSGIISVELQNILSKGYKDLTLANSNIGTLTSLLSEFTDAVGKPDQVDLQNAVLQKYLALLSSTKFHSEPDINNLSQIVIPGINASINNFKQEVDSACYRVDGA